MSGAGNDFIVLDNRFYNFTDEELSGLAGRFCPRRWGVGADGLLALNNPQGEDVHYRMRYFNADGSRATMCGNGARCLARYARASGMKDPRLRFESDAGVFVATVPDEAAAPVRLFVPDPRNYVADHLLEGQAPVAPLYTIWTGTEHAVAFVEDVEATPVEEWGRAIRRDASLAPEGVNVNFVEVVDGGGAEARVRVRTFEKGVEDETLACGTGALAAAVVAHLAGKVEATRVEVAMPGGALGVGFSRRGNMVTELYLEGPAETIYRGSLELNPRDLTRKK